VDTVEVALRNLLVSGTFFSVILLAGGPASAAVSIHINLATQTMRVSDGGQTYVWPVSSAGAGYSTPTGDFHPTRLSANHFSHEYDMAPMPYSIFFKDGYAIHGTNLVSLLGRPASHGCVHLSVAHAALLYKLVQKQGANIDITGAPPIYSAQRTAPNWARPVEARAEGYSYGQETPTYSDQQSAYSEQQPEYDVPQAGQVYAQQQPEGGYYAEQQASGYYSQQSNSGYQSAPQGGSWGADSSW
jgi:hypothetical protein